MKSFTDSNGKSIISKRWHQNIKDIVNEYNFSLINAYYVPGLIRSDWKKCEFCGQRHRYVAVINGKPIISGVGVSYEIGFDCLEMVFGRNWNNSERELKGLKLSALSTDRKQKYSEKYKDIINWFNNIDSSYLSTNSFLLAMKKILETGCKPFSINMETGVKKFMNSNISKYEYNKKLKVFKEVTIPNIKKVLDLVSTFSTSSRDYCYVKSVYEQSINLNKCSSSQFEYLNKIRKLYLDKSTRTELVDNTIPY